MGVSVSVQREREREMSGNINYEICDVVDGDFDGDGDVGNHHHLQQQLHHHHTSPDGVNSTTIIIDENLNEDSHDTDAAFLISPAPPSSVVIMHSIASYLSLGDAMSMSVAAAATTASSASGLASRGGGGMGFQTPSPTRGEILRSAASAPMHRQTTIDTAAATSTIAQCHSFEHHHDRHSLANTLLLLSPEEMEEEEEEDECMAEIIASASASAVGGDFNAKSFWGRMNQGENHNIHVQNNHDNDDDDDVGLILGVGEEDEENEEDWFVGGGIRGMSSSPIDEDQPAQLPQHPYPLQAPPPSLPTPPARAEAASWTPAGQATGECENDNNCAVRYSPPHTPQPLPPSYPQKSHNHPHDIHLQKLQQRQRKQLLQNKLAAAVFSHPHPLRQYCLDAYATALGLSAERRRRRMIMMMTRSPGGTGMAVSSSSQGIEGRDDGETTRLPTSKQGTRPSNTVAANSNTMTISPASYFAPSQQQGPPLIHILLTAVIYDNIPLSIILELLESTCDLSISTLWATGHITTSTMEHIFSSIWNIASHILNILSKFNPFHVLEFILNAQRRAMGKTGDVLVSGIQSVATGVGSVSNAALNRLSRSGLALAGGVVGSRSSSHHVGEGWGVGHHHHHNHHHRAGGVAVGDKILDSKLFHRLQKMESVSRLVAYSERVGEEAFSAHAKKRAQRMMHYTVSFRPFTATIVAGGGNGATGGSSKKKSGKMKHSVSFERSVCGGTTPDDRDGDNGSVSSESINSSGSLFMRTPTSFPPTPTSRLYYFERGSQFTENVVFLARDQLRVERGVIDQNLQTRAMAKALIDGSRLAVFDATCVGYGIVLSCGQHIATKVGNELYSSARSMIPVMRNTYVYFEISVSPSMIRNDPNSSGMHPVVDTATLLVGLSTLEMPLDTLVGAYPGTVGLCSSGQILQSGQWRSLSNTEDSCYGSSSTVGCLVYLDDSSAYETSDGPHVTVDVTFNINGVIVPPYSSSSNDATTSSLSAMQEGSSDGCIEPTLSLIAPKAYELFPTVTLHSSRTSVMCRFNSEDLLATSRTEIGAQPGVVVYAVDGSVILDESEEDEFLESSSRCSDFRYSHVSL